MTRELRWRIITLQVVLVVIFAFGAGLAYWGYNFNTNQIKSQLEPQKIFFPKDVTASVAAAKAFPDLQVYADDLQKYQGQQVLTGDQAHVYAESYLGVHLRTLDNGKVYSQLSDEARAEKDPALKAKLDGLVQTAFRGETLRSMLNQAWAFSIFGTMALYASIGLAVGLLIVLGALVFELFFATRPQEEPIRKPSFAPTKA